MLSYLTHKLRTQSLNESETYNVETDDDRDSGTESDDEGAEIEELQKYMETIIHLDSNRRRTKRLPLAQVTKPDPPPNRPHLPHRRRLPDSALPSDTDPDTDPKTHRRNHKSSSDTDLHHLSDADFKQNRRFKTPPDTDLHHLSDADFKNHMRRSNKFSPDADLDTDFKHNRRIRSNNKSSQDTDLDKNHKRRTEVFFDADLHHSSEEELEVINAHHHPEKRKWVGGDPVEFIADPPEDVYRPTWCVRQAHIPMHELCAVSPRKKHRRTPVVAIQRPCLDFEKMQQINRVRLL